MSNFEWTKVEPGPILTEVDHVIRLPIQRIELKTLNVLILYQDNMIEILPNLSISLLG